MRILLLFLVPQDSHFGGLIVYMGNAWRLSWCNVMAFVWMDGEGVGERGFLHHWCILRYLNAGVVAEECFPLCIFHNGMAI